MAKSKSAKGFSFLLKIILVIIWDLYGLLRRLESKKTSTKLIGIILFIFGGFGIFWLIDLICVLLNKDISLFK